MPVTVFSTIAERAAVAVTPNARRLFWNGQPIYVPVALVGRTGVAMAGWAAGEDAAAPPAIGVSPAPRRRPHGPTIDARQMRQILANPDAAENSDTAEDASMAPDADGPDARGRSPTQRDRPGPDSDFPIELVDGHLPPIQFLYAVPLSGAEGPPDGPGAGAPRNASAGGR